jgi:hypothetical protein
MPKTNGIFFCIKLSIIFFVIYANLQHNSNSVNFAHETVYERFLMKNLFVLEGLITSEQPLATCSKDLMEREGGDRKPTPVPSCNTALGRRLMFPGTGLRGALRRSARDAIRQRITKITLNEKPWTLDEVYLATLGGIKGAGEQERSSVAHEAAWREKNPLLSLFGAGDAGWLGFVSGNISVGNAICKNDCQPEIFSGARTDEFYRDKTQIQFLSDDDIQSLIKRAKGGKSAAEIRSQIKKLETDIRKASKAGNTEKTAELQTTLSDLTEQLSTVKGTSGTSDNSIGMPLAGWQAIPQGEEMTHRIILSQTNDVELGLMLAGLDVFSRSPLIGAHYATGCGLISGSWTIHEVTEAGKIDIGKITIGDFSPIQITGDKLHAALAAFETFMINKQWDFSIPTME